MKPVLLPKKQKSRSIPNLLSLLTTHFNRFIRNRDKGLPCISCGKTRELCAGHFYPAGKVSALKFNEDNVHGQCDYCNRWMSGNLNYYRLNLEKKIGKERLLKLDELALMRGHRWDRFTLEMKLEEYKTKNKKAG